MSFLQLLMPAQLAVRIFSADAGLGLLVIYQFNLAPCFSIPDNKHLARHTIIETQFYSIFLFL